MQQNYVFNGAKNQYQIICKLNEGAISEVYKAQILQTQEFVAIKVLNRLRRIDNMPNIYFESEVEICQQLAKMSHLCANIANIIEVIQCAQSYLIVQEFCQYGNLYQNMLSNQGYLDDRSKLIYSILICEGLVFLHNNNIVHRDLKPENIMIAYQNGQYRLKITDYGLCKQSEDLFTSFVGTIIFMAPEILKNENYTKKVDIWSMGCIMDEIVREAPTFDGQSINEIKERVINYQGYKQNNFLSQIISKCLVVDPNQRIDSVQLLSELKSLINQLENQQNINYQQQRQQQAEQEIQEKNEISNLDQLQDYIQQPLQSQIRIQASKIKTKLDASKIKFQGKENVLINNIEYLSAYAQNQQNQNGNNFVQNNQQAILTNSKQQQQEDIQSEVYQYQDQYQQQQQQQQQLQQQQQQQENNQILDSYQIQNQQQCQNQYVQNSQGQIPLQINPQINYQYQESNNQNSVKNDFDFNHQNLQNYENHQNFYQIKNQNNSYNIKQIQNQLQNSEQQYGYSQNNYQQNYYIQEESKDNQQFLNRSNHNYDNELKNISNNFLNLHIGNEYNLNYQNYNQIQFYDNNQPQQNQSYSINNQAPQFKQENTQNLQQCSFVSYPNQNNYQNYNQEPNNYENAQLYKADNNYQIFNYYQQNLNSQQIQIHYQNNQNHQQDIHNNICQDQINAQYNNNKQNLNNQQLQNISLSKNNYEKYQQNKIANQKKQSSGENVVYSNQQINSQKFQISNQDQNDEEQNNVLCDNFQQKHNLNNKQDPKDIINYQKGEYYYLNEINNEGKFINNIQEYYKTISQYKEEVKNKSEEFLKKKKLKSYEECQEFQQIPDKFCQTEEKFENIDDNLIFLTPNYSEFCVNIVKYFLYLDILSKFSKKELCLIDIILDILIENIDAIESNLSFNTKGQGDYVSKKKLNLYHFISFLQEISRSDPQFSVLFYDEALKKKQFYSDTFEVVGDKINDKFEKKIKNIKLIQDFQQNIQKPKAIALQKSNSRVEEFSDIKNLLNNHINPQYRFQKFFYGDKHTEENLKYYIAFTKPEIEVYEEFIEQISQNYNINIKYHLQTEYN